MKSIRGVAELALLYVLAGAALGVFVGTWKPFLGFKKPPPTVELTQAQADLAAARAAAAQLEKEKDAAHAADKRKLEEQVRFAQQDNAGTIESLKRVPAQHRTPEVKLAESMAVRVDLKLAAAIGKLPIEQQDAMVELIAQALSGKQAEVDEAMRKLAELDAKFAIVTKERDTIKAQIPVIEKQLTAAEQKAQQAEEKVLTLTGKVKDWANKTFAKEKEAGSLGAALENALFWLAIAVAALILWITCAWWLPKLLDFVPSGVVKNTLRHTAGTIAGGAWYIDAHQKLTRLKNEQIQK